tara:strand:- start:76733 stop:77134 length:402 start_codon:yes stop_codon:yes gene_type:complete
MKLLKEYLLSKKPSWPAFCVSRSNMPQLHYPSFKKFVERLEIGFSESLESNWDDIQPTQTDFDQNKVDKIINSYNESDDKTPILISEDRFVLDGHHRYYAAKQGSLPWPIMEINLPINKLMKLAYDFIEYENS